MIAAVCRMPGCGAGAKEPHRFCGAHLAMLPPKVRSQQNQDDGEEASAVLFLQEQEAARRPRICGLTIMQPWASCIALGPKRVENRTWAPFALSRPVYLAIHAGKQDDDAQAWRVASRLWPQLDGLRATMPRSAIVAVARFLEVQEHETVAAISDEAGERMDPWACGPWCWCLGDVVPISPPLPCRGAQGLWGLPEFLLASLRARWAHAKE